MDNQQKPIYAYLSISLSKLHMHIMPHERKIYGPPIIGGNHKQNTKIGV